jgi:hypothetical protein
VIAIKWTTTSASNGGLGAAGLRLESEALGRGVAGQKRQVFGQRCGLQFGFQVLPEMMSGHFLTGGRQPAGGTDGKVMQNDTARQRCTARVAAPVPFSLRGAASHLAPPPGFAGAIPDSTADDQGPCRPGRRRQS